MRPDSLRAPSEQPRPWERINPLLHCFVDLVAIFVAGGTRSEARVVLEFRPAHSFHQVNPLTVGDQDKNPSLRCLVNPGWAYLVVIASHPYRNEFAAADRIA